MEKLQNEKLTREERIDKMKDGGSFIIIDKGLAGHEVPIGVPADNVYVIDEISVTPKAGETIYIHIEEDKKAYISKREVIVEGQMKTKKNYKYLLDAEIMKEKALKAYSSKIVFVPLAIIAIGLIFWSTSMLLKKEPEEIETVIPTETKTVQDVKVGKSAWKDPEEATKVKLNLEDESMKSYELKVAKTIEINEESYIIAGFNKGQEDNTKIEDIKIALFSDTGEMLYESEEYSSKVYKKGDPQYPFKSIQVLQYDKDLLVLIELLNVGGDESDTYSHVLGYVIEEDGETVKVYDRSAKMMQLSVVDNRFFIMGDIGDHYLSLEDGEIKIER